MRKKPKIAITLKETDPNLEWSLGTLLGSGTFGKVYAATHKNGLVGAAKICDIDNEDVFLDMKQEAEILLSCDNIYILKAFSCYSWEKTVWMVLELCQGGSLADICIYLEGFDEPTIRVIMYQCTLGLQYLHRKCIIHRDIKLGNIMLTDKGICKIADYGISAVLNTPDELRDTFIGTPYWMAPEVILAETNPCIRYQAKCDVYSLGITACEGAEMFPPGWDLSPAHVRLSRLRNVSPTLEDPSRWSLDFRKWVAAAVTKDPVKRPTATQLLSLPFLSTGGDNTEILIDIYNMVKTGVVEEEEDHNQVDGSVNEGFEDLEDLPPPPDDISSRFSMDSHITEEGESMQPSAKISPILKSTRTIRRTYRYKVDGVEKNKTIIKEVVSEDKQNMISKKNMQDKMDKQNKLFEAQEQRDRRKLKANQDSQISDLLIRHEVDFSMAMTKYTYEIESQTKWVLKEVEKKRVQLKADVEKAIKKTKCFVEKETKIHLAAMKSKNKGKYNISYLDLDFIPSLQSAKIQELEQLLNSQNAALREYSATLVHLKHNNLDDHGKGLVILRMQQLTEMFNMRKNHILSKFELFLQQSIKSEYNEIQASLKFMQNKVDKLKAQHAQDIRNMPKLQRQIIKRNVEVYKKSLRKNRTRNEKELVQKRQSELMENMENEIRVTIAAQEADIQDLEAIQQQELKEIQEYRNEINKASHRSFQTDFYCRYLEDETLCKTEMLKLYMPIQKRQSDYISELQFSKNIGIDVNISSGIFG